MEKTIIILAGSFMLAATSCNLPVSNKMDTAITDSLTLSDSLNRDPLIKKQTAIQDSIEKNAVKIIKYYTTEPNSAGRVSANIIWKNTSSKIIKYVRFSVVPYNAVDDIVNCTIRGYSETRVKTTGPFKPGKTYGYDSEWDNLWYNYSIKKMKIASFEVDFMN